MNNTELQDPLLQRSYALHFAVLALLSLACTLWALYDEAYTRRPWKEHQRQWQLQSSASPKDRIAIREIYLAELNVIDRCPSCHLGIVEANRDLPQPFSGHPGDYLKTHPPARFGCTPCHRGQGYATTEDSHGRVEYWTRPMLPGAFMQADCQKCHSPRELKGAPALALGYRLFAEKGCIGCHNVEGYRQETFGPPLAHLRSKVKPDWVYHWLKRPGDYFPRHRMPDFMLTDEEAAAIVSYLFSLPAPELAAVKWDPIFNKTEEELGDDEWEEWDRVMTAGEKAFRELRCNICHDTTRGGGVVSYAPPFTTIQSKISGRDWLYHWLSDPHAMFEHSAMPHYRLSDSEKRGLVHYLLKHPEFSGRKPQPAPVVSTDPAILARGKSQVTHYGCAGCHDLPGHENDSKAGADLTRFGERPVEQLDFPWDIPKNHGAWVMAKLKDPRPRLRPEWEMPYYPLTDREREALSVFLTGFGEKNVPLRYIMPDPWPHYRPVGPAGELIERYRCLTCHTIRGSGGEYAPDLTYEGSKVQFAWLVRFLQNPDVIRPMSQQMPKFNISAEEALLLANYLHLALVYPARPSLGVPGDREQVIAQGVSCYRQCGCYACHQIQGAGGGVGPPLSDTGRRLTHDYLLRHLKDPLAAVPRTREPNLGLSDEQVSLLAAYLMTLKKGD